jgi:hypothetical protein
MMHHELTAPRRAATPPGMNGAGAGIMARDDRNWRGALAVPGLVLSAMLAGCINIAAPDEPIVIELNVNIRQEVILRLAEDAKNTIEENADIF